MPTSGSIADATQLRLDTASSAPEDADATILAMFDRCAPQLLRYVGSFGLTPEETEDVVQDTFLALFRHLQLRRDQRNLPGWLFQVAHNLALKRRHGNLKQRWHVWAPEFSRPACVDPSPDPEECLLRDERGRRLRAVFDALPDRERRCLLLRAEGVTYRDIARSLRVSLGSVSKAVTRAVRRLMNADGG